MNQRLYKRIIKKIKFIGASEGVSMMPIIHPQDGLYIKPLKTKELKTNDIVTFQKKDILVSHRIIYRKKGYIIAKGDNNFYSDGKIFPKQIVGTVYQIKRNRKTLNPDRLYLIQSTLYFQEIVKIKHIFEKKKIDFVFLKGLPLHLYFESSHPKRIYSDCDVLIRKEDFFKVEKIIERLGYKRDRKSKKKQVENNYFKIINGFPVVFDIHLEAAFMMTQLPNLEALYRQKLIDKFTEELLNNTRRITINDEKFFILDNKYLILYLALHIFHHNFRGAFRYDFLDKIIVRACREQNKKYIFLDLARKINEYRLQNFVHPVFVLLKKHYQTPIPKPFIKAIKPLSNVTIKQFDNLNIFDEESRFRAGINRFVNLFLLSPEPWVRKIWAFLNPQVIYSLFLVVLTKLRGKVVSARS